MSVPFNSLTLRLLALTLLVVVLCGGAAVLASYRSALHEADELMDAQMAQTAQTLLALTSRKVMEAAAEGSDLAADTGLPRHKYQAKLMFQLWHVDARHARLVMRSPNAPTEMVLMSRGNGFLTGTWEGRKWRFYAQDDADLSMLVIVGQDFAIREELASETARHGLVPFLVGLPVLALLLYFAIRTACSPVRRLADDLAAREPDNLRPVVIGQVAREIEPVTDALNRLFARLQATLENERRFTSDAAHELRTPIAAMIAQLQVAQMAAGNGPTQQTLKKCEKGARRLSHLVDQMLTLARLDAAPGKAVPERADLAAEAAAVCADLGPAAVEGKLGLELDTPGPLFMRGQSELLRVMLRNLVDNAIRYTPVDGRVDVSLRAEDGVLVCVVQDSGPGVPAEEIGLLGQRFRRLAANGADGVGLGLSIVRRIVALHGGRIEFENLTVPSGLRVTVRLPAAT